MPLLPEDVSSKSLRHRWWRGYDRHQVQAFLRDVATDYEAAISRLAMLADERSRAQTDNDNLHQKIDALTRQAEVPLPTQSGTEARAAELATEAGAVPIPPVASAVVPAAVEPVPPIGSPVTAIGPAAADHQHRPLIVGQVKESGNTPLPGATLTLTDLSGGQLDRDSSDSGGHYRLAPPIGGSYLVICASVAHQPTAALVAVADVPVRHDVILFGGGASLSGTVYSAGHGEPIAGGVVTLVNIRGDVVAAVSTEPDGRFSFHELAQGHYTLTVAVTTLQPVAHAVEVPASGLVHHDVEVAARVQLVGLVRTPTAGAPVPEALTTLITSDGHVVGSAITDTDGRFVFDDLTAGVYTVIATGYPPVAAKVQLGIGAPTETVITLWPPMLADAAAGSRAVGGRAEREGDGHGHRRRPGRHNRIPHPVALQHPRLRWQVTYDGR